MPFHWRTKNANHSAADDTLAKPNTETLPDSNLGYLTTSAQTNDTEEPDKPRRKSFIEKWKDLCNPKAEFSDETIKERTGMNKEEFEKWLQVPENQKLARKMFPSSSYWASI